VRGAAHRKLLHPVVLAPKQDFLSLVPIVCPPGHFTYMDAQAVTDEVACDDAVTQLIGCIYRFANSCEQIRSRPLPPGPLPDIGLSADAVTDLEARIAEKVRRLQDLADSTTRLLSAVFNSVSPQIILEGPLAELTAAIEDLVGSRMADTAVPMVDTADMLAEGGAAVGSLISGVIEGPAPQPESDPLRDIWNDVRGAPRSGAVAPDHDREAATPLCHGRGASGARDPGRRSIAANHRWRGQRCGRPPARRVQRRRRHPCQL
jgi:hypothetical protein